MENKPTYHIPVMLSACLEGLAIHPEGTYIDVTFGGGGHAKEIYKKLSNKGLLIAFDQDPDAAKNIWEAPNFKFIAANFSFLSNHLKLMGISQVDGILADLGVSSHQFDADERGFSIRSNAPLDMRMNQSGERSAYHIVNTYSEEQLIKLFRLYGELKNARSIAAAIVHSREVEQLRTTGDLITVIKPFAPKFKEHKFYAQVFQAIRIEVNQEISVLERFLEQTAHLLKPGGRLVVMSYHSLEDRLVKNLMKRGSLSGEVTKDFFGNIQKPFTEVTRHPLIPSEEEISVNQRARSAKLRIATRNER
jgi:16S rRNA (cytosine1402-N4)-methyltransferase